MLRKAIQASLHDVHFDLRDTAAQVGQKVLVRADSASASALTAHR